MNAPREQGWAIWVVGLPGSGKSNLARAVSQAFGSGEGGPSGTISMDDGGEGALPGETVWLQMDARRKVYFPEPTYSTEEREEAYRLFAEEAAALTRRGVNVVMDGAAYKAAFREYARSLIPRFAEVHVQCTLENAMKREAGRSAGLVMAGLYSKALERKRTGREFPGLGEVIGVDVPFEENPAAEFTICNDDIPKQETRRRTLKFLAGWLGREPRPTDLS